MTSPLLELKPTSDLKPRSDLKPTSSWDKTSGSRFSIKNPSYLERIFFIIVYFIFVFALLKTALPLWGNITLHLLVLIYFFQFIFLQKKGDCIAFISDQQCEYLEQVWTIETVFVFFSGSIVFLKLKSEKNHSIWIRLWPDQLTADRRSELCFLVQKE